jgi:PEP-CTERM motif
MCKLLTVGLALSASLFSTCAHAVLLDFNLANGIDTITWQLDSNPDPFFSDTGNQFALVNLPINVNGVAAFSRTHFRNQADLGGLILFSVESGYIDATGPQLYTGSERTPTFSLGNYLLSGSPGYQLTIANAILPGAVPEPANWALMIAGLGLAGAATRRQRTKLMVAYALSLGGQPPAGT